VNPLRLRRSLLMASALAPLTSAANAATVEFAKVLAQPLVFPRDHGAHPDYRVEWWYLTGCLQDNASGAPLGIQVTFFRVRTPIDPDNPSRFAAHQLLFAHVALADAANASLLIDQRIARVSSSVVRMAQTDTDIDLNRWRLSRSADGRYECEVPARSFRLHFVASPSQPVLQQGQDGLFPKQAGGGYASHYYSAPQLRIEAEIQRADRKQVAGGLAWLDHEWASTLLEPQAVGWDWLGMNLADGTALTAFQTRRKDDGAILFAYASMRSPDQAAARVFPPNQVRFEGLREWESPRTRARYPVAQRVSVGERVFETRPWFADQELDARATGSAIYWEGASELLEGGRPVGRGYLEMTGYAAPLTL